MRLLPTVLAAASFLQCSALVYASPQVTKVEPPNWWVGHTVNPVRVLIRGSGFEGASVHAATGLSVGNVRVNESGTYLFADITISPSAKPGDYSLEVRASGGSVNAPFRLDRPLSPTGRFQGFSQDDVIYLIMPDRFADGDESNDDPAISRGLFDRNKPRSYHGGDLQGIIDHLPYLQALGVTALWLTPVYDNLNHLNEKQTVEGQPVTDYHGYGAIDYYSVEEHLGNLALLRELVDRAHARA